MSNRITHPVNAIIFDLDGTLLNTLDDLADATNAALRQNDLPTHSTQDICRFVGNGIGKLIERAVSDGRNNPKFEQVLSDFKDYYQVHCMDKTGPYAQIEELLAELKAREIPMAIVSNKIDVAVKDLAKHFFADYISVAIGEMEGVARKPAPDMAQKALKELGALPEETIYVGDSEVDLLTATNAKLTCVSVTWGFRTEDFLCQQGAKHMIAKPMELLDLLEDYKSKNKAL